MYSIASTTVRRSPACLRPRLPGALNTGSSSFHWSSVRSLGVRHVPHGDAALGSCNRDTPSNAPALHGRAHQSPVTHLRDARVSARRRNGPADWEVLRTYLSGSPFSDRSESVVSVMVSDLVGAGTEPMSTAEPMVSVVVSGPLHGCRHGHDQALNKVHREARQELSGEPSETTEATAFPRLPATGSDGPEGVPPAESAPAPPSDRCWAVPVTTVTQPVADPPETPTFGGTPPDQPKHPRGDRVPHASRWGDAPWGTNRGTSPPQHVSRVSGTAQRTSTANGSRTR